MKTTFTFLFVLCIGFGVQAQTESKSDQEPATEKTIPPTWDARQVNQSEPLDMARLYRYRISRIKKALSFTAKKSKAKVV